MGAAYDRVVTDIFTTPLDKPLVRFDLPLVTDKLEYLLPSGIGHVYEIQTLSEPVIATSGISRYVTATVPAFRQDDVRGEGWVWNPPILRFDQAPSANTTIRVIFLPRGLEFMHIGSITEDTEVINATYDTSFTLVPSTDATGTFKVTWKGNANTGTIAVDAAAATVKTQLETITGITTIDVADIAAGGWTATFNDPSGTLPPFEVSTEPTTGSITVTRVSDPRTTTIKLNASPTVGLFDPRPNAFIGGRLVLLSGSVPYGYQAHIWQERDIIEYDAATRIATLSSPFDFTPYGTIGYEVLPLIGPHMIQVCTIEVARMIHGMGGNLQRRNSLANEYKIALTTARRLNQERNKALGIMATPERYRRPNTTSDEGVVLEGTITVGPDRITF
jgi:hypothetical protein